MNLWKLGKLHFYVLLQSGLGTSTSPCHNAAVLQYVVSVYQMTTSAGLTVFTRGGWWVRPLVGPSIVAAIISVMDLW